jgi:hypothetical protein
MRHRSRGRAFNNLNPDVDPLVNSCGVRDKAIIQVCCTASVILSFKNKEATRVGINGSQAFIEQTKHLANVST